MSLSINLELEYAEDCIIKVAWNEEEEEFRVIQVEGLRVAKEFWKLFSERTGGNRVPDSRFVKDDEVLDGAHLSFEELPYVLTEGKTIRIYNNASSKKQTWVWKDTIRRMTLVTTP